MDYKKLRALIDKTLTGERDALFSVVKQKVFCMSTPRNYALLNAIVSSMEPGELYVEVGTFQGGSLISALTGNAAVAVGVDDFHEFQPADNNYEKTMTNLKAFGVDDRVTLYSTPYQKYFSEVIQPDQKIAVYFYDGEHNYEGQLAGMEAGWPHLQPGSILIVDDFLYPEVNRAINQFIVNHAANVKILFTLDSMNDCDATWWNGVFCLRVI